MEIKTFKKLDTNVYEETLENGLRVFIAPLKRNGISVSYTTLFGGKDISFIPEGSDEIYDCPPGVAHFLEHKMFDRKGESVFNFFNKSGTYNNAFTYKEKTKYIFQGPTNFEENLNFLLDYVATPTFTKTKVEKEKPIILEEARSNFDNPINMAFDTAMKNCFHENPYMFPIIGTFPSIEAITKEDIEMCYKTFYNPANMILVITGNVDPKKTIEIVKNNFAKRSYSSNKKAVKLKYDEPDSVAREYEEANMPITNEVFYLAYKINKEKLNMDLYKLNHYLKSLFILKLGSLSLFNDENLRNGDLLGQLGSEIIDIDDHIVFGIYGEVKNSTEILHKIQNELGDLSIEEKDLELLKKSTLSNLILMNEQVTGTNNKIEDDVCKYGKVIYDVYDIIKNLNINEYNELIKNIDLSNYTIAIAKNKKIS